MRKLITTTTIWEEHNIVFLIILLFILFVSVVVVLFNKGVYLTWITIYHKAVRVYNECKCSAQGNNGSLLMRYKLMPDRSRVRKAYRRVPFYLGKVFCKLIKTRKSMFCLYTVLVSSGDVVACHYYQNV